jgi:hypothetical protein
MFIEQMLRCGIAKCGEVSYQNGSGCQLNAGKFYLRNRVQVQVPVTLGAAQ